MPPTMTATGAVPSSGPVNPAAELHVVQHMPVDGHRGARDFDVAGMQTLGAGDGHRSPDSDSGTRLGANKSKEVGEQTGE